MKQPIAVHKSNSLPRTFSPNRGNRIPQTPSPRTNRTHTRQQSENVSQIIFIRSWTDTQSRTYSVDHSLKI